MSLSIGTLVGYLQLDDSNFNRKADNADRKLNALKLHLEALKRENPKISVEVDAQTAKIDELKIKIADLKAQAAKGADVRVDIVQAMVDLDRVQSKVRELHGKTIKVDVDDRAAVAKLDGLAKKTNGLSALMTGVLTLGPALIPITAAAGGLVAALGAPIAAAGGGGTLYALIAGQAVKSTEKQSKAIDALKKKVDAAQVSLNKASTPAGRKSAAVTLAADTAAYNAALAKLNPQQQAFLKAQAAMGKSFTTLLHTAGPSVFGPLTLGMDLLAKDMPKVAPVLKSVSGALTDLMRELSHSGALDSFTGFLAKFSGPSIRSAGQILGNIAAGVGAIGMAFMPVGQSVSKSLLDWSEGFAKVGSSKGLSDFVGYVQREGPQVAHTLAAVGRAVGQLVRDLAPLGDLSLKFIHGVANAVTFLAKLPGASVLLELAAAGVGISKAVSLLAKIPGAGGLLGSIGGKAALGAGVKIAGKSVVPVYVTNPGFGGGLPGGGGRDGGSKIPPWLSASPYLLPLLTSGDSGPAAPSVQQRNSLWAVLNHQTGHTNDPANPSSFMSMLAGSNPARALAMLKQAASTAGVPWASAKNSGAFKDWVAQINQAIKSQKGLNDLLLGPALPTYTKRLKSLPPVVQTAVKTPGAVQSISQVSTLAKAYHLTPKQIVTLARLTGAQGSMTDIRALAKAYGLTPKQVRTIIDLQGAGPALSAIAKVKAELASVPRSISTQYYVTQTTGINKRGKHATGGLLVGPGTGTSDSIPLLGSNGEFMVSAAAVRRYGVGLFEDLNAMRLATGGSVSNPKSAAHQRALAHARQNLRRTRLEVELKDAQTKLKHYQNILSQADAFASAFAPNVFAAGLPTTKDVTVPGGVSTQVINGQVVTTRGAGTTKTVNLSNQQILADMLRYAKQQKAQDVTLAKNIKKLKAEGLSKSVIEQMQAAGPAGIAQINALASGTKADVRQFNSLNTAAQNALNQAGAQGVAGQSYQKLKNQQVQEQTIVNGIQKAFKHMKLHVAGTNLRLV